ncbi:MAG: DUF4167 domain-containing protein [Candidatus Liberibacter europaeus]|uniref:DUF4167 domain-containing protein n=1 Tax=Candidatus Liberibacter europaeus TaxID=744859 RepID=A0A2T4VYB0_9HYPH|nr:DUF4167 domain-containing protein [Candidatus Liberibacter europaeus]PTL86769.1 MAG: DUF4167 domain-containing protein [Candidatus Liberibacter europaeus]
MRSGQQYKRSRGRGSNSGNGNFNRKNVNPLVRNYDSSGYDVKVRGTAQHIAERYSSLARDAISAGDYIVAENHFQHAEHYNRIIAVAQAQIQEKLQRDEKANLLAKESRVNVDNVTNGFGDNPVILDTKEDPLDISSSHPKIDDKAFESPMDREVPSKRPYKRNPRSRIFSRNKPTVGKDGSSSQNQPNIEKSETE